ncbi:universal stress protein [Pseudoxanthomonas wuyuanensis]|uniref:Nucleotide-binding universal stress protein, UspA family n=1 Tax=Pseudoxanthomonas wuyuanensis TaxID=1073196 RepID=A0A286D8A0_9GAMM|nr:universal stress protein [Pseudoxanthomonas wuyuanensis]KAF1717314.1 universal stress protein [Pseudoxanthomonas wuyuanensis]SOD54891.1 Nucleotide-binding universal stress protein, UspA family [Pseudoxanthomonas wuyuanensis]
MYKRILIAVDGSELAARGLEQGLVLASQLQAEVAVVTVSEPQVTGYEGALGWGGAYNLLPEYQRAQQEAATRVLDAAREKAQAAGIAAEVVHVPDRYAADAIIETAEARGSDLIVMASHGRRGLGRLVLGSQTSEVLARSRIPVLVIR